MRELVPRRSRCRECGGTHVLLPAWCLLRRADAGEVIGAALEAAAAGDGHRKIAGRLGRPASTVRGWLRAFARRAEQVRLVFTALAAARTGSGDAGPAGAGRGGGGGGRGGGGGGSHGAAGRQGGGVAAASAATAGCCWPRGGRPGGQHELALGGARVSRYPGDASSAVFTEEVGHGRG